MTGGLGDRHRPRGPRAAPDALEDVLRLRDGVRRAAEPADLPGLPRHAGRPAGHQPPGHRVRHPHRARAPLPDQRRVPLRPEALLLPRHAEELPDQPVRGAAGRGRVARDRGRRRRAPDRDRAPPPGGGRRQAHPRGRSVRDGEREPGRLQPRRACRSWRSSRGRISGPRPRPPSTCGASGRSSGTSASATGTWRRARSAATPTSRSGAPGRPSSAPRSRSRT